MRRGRRRRLLHPSGWVLVSNERESLHLAAEGRKDPAEGKLFEELALPSLDELYRLACRLEADVDRAQDLLQEAMVVAFKSFHQLREPSSFRAWAAAIVRRTHLNRLARRGGDAQIDEIEKIPPLEGPREPFDPERRLLARRLTSELKGALDRLPPDQRTAVLLVDVQGFRFAEAAEALGVAPGTVASRVARGRAALRHRLEYLARERGWIRP